MRNILIFFFITFFINIVCYAEAENSSQKHRIFYHNNTHQAVKQSKHNKIIKGYKEKKNQEQRKLNLSLPKDIMAKVRKDKKTEQSDDLHDVLPNLFVPSSDAANFGISAGLIKSVNMKEKGDIDGAKIQFRFKQ